MWRNLCDTYAERTVPTKNLNSVRIFYAAITLIGYHPRRKSMPALHKRNPQTPYKQELLQREIDATDAQIDRLVYDLYGLTEEEIKIVEGETKE